MNDQILDVKQEIGDLKTALIETGVDVGPAIYLARVFGTDVDTVVKFFIFILIFVFDPMAVALVIAYNITMVNRQQGSLDGGTTVNQSKKKPKRLGLYKEGKSMMEKIVKETFIPDDEEEVKKDDEVIYDSNVDTLDVGIKGAITYPEVVERTKKNRKNEKK
jgi:hypothetical protein